MASNTTSIGANFENIFSWRDTGVIPPMVFLLELYSIAKLYILPHKIQSEKTQAVFPEAELVERHNHTSMFASRSNRSAPKK